MLPRTFSTEKKAIEYVKEHPGTAYEQKIREDGSFAGYKVSLRMPRAPTVKVRKLPKVRYSQGGAIRGKRFSGSY